MHHHRHKAHIDTVKYPTLARHNVIDNQLGLAISANRFVLFFAINSSAITLVSDNMICNE